MKNRIIYIISPNPQFNKQGDFAGDPGMIMMSNAELENFISNQLFPIGIVPGGAIEYLKSQHLRTIKYIGEYIITHMPCSKEHPAQISQLKDAIKMALIEGNIDIAELREFDETEVYEWKNAKENGEIGPFGSIKRK